MGPSRRFAGLCLEAPLQWSRACGNFTPRRPVPDRRWKDCFPRRPSRRLGVRHRGEGGSGNPAPPGPKAGTGPTLNWGRYGGPGGHGKPREDLPDQSWPPSRLPGSLRQRSHRPPICRRAESRHLARSATETCAAWPFWAMAAFRPAPLRRGMSMCFPPREAPLFFSRKTRTRRSPISSLLQANGDLLAALTFSTNTSEVRTAGTTEKPKETPDLPPPAQVGKVQRARGPGSRFPVKVGFPEALSVLESAGPIIIWPSRAPSS